MSNNLFGANNPNAQKSNIFGSSSNTNQGGMFGGNNNQPASNQGGNLFGNKPTQPPAQQGGGNVFSNTNQPSNTSGGIFGGQQQPPANNAPTGNNIFGGGSNTNQAQGTGGNLFGNKPQQNKPAVGGGMFSNQTATQPNTQPTQNTNIFNANNPQGSAPGQPSGGLFSNNTAATTNQQQGQQSKPVGGGGVFGMSNPAQQFPQSSSPFATNTAQTGLTSQPQQNATQANQSTSQPSVPQQGGNIFNQTSSSTNLFGQKPEQNKAQGTTGNTPANTTGTTQPSNTPVIGGNTTAPTTGNNLFSGNTASNTNAATTNAPTTTNQPPAQSPTTPTTQPTNTTGGNLFGGNANQPATSNTTTTPPATNLFGNAGNKPTGAFGAATTQPANQNQGPTNQATTSNTGGMFNNAGNQPQPASNPGQQGNQPTGQQPTQPTGQQPNQQPTFGSNPSSNPPPPVSNKSAGQLQFDKNASKSVKEYLTTARQEMDTMYSELLKYSNNLIRYQHDREENVKIYRHFEEIKPQFLNNSENNNRILSNLQQQQAQVQNSLRLITESIKPQRTDHSLITCLQDSLQLSHEIVQLQTQNEPEDRSAANNPSHEQLMLLYSSLDKLQTDVDNMNQLLEICFSVGPTYNNQDNQYAGNYSTGYGYGYNSRY